jgi:type III restriction enzyme
MPSGERVSALTTALAILACNCFIQREKELFNKGIKVLSLFFIDEVDHYRIYDESGQPQNGLFATMFEEEYTDIISNLQREIGDEDYVKYLEAIPVEKTHAGYFSIDKKGRMVDEYAGKKKVENSDDVSAYDLIMKNTLRCWKK